MATSSKPRSVARFGPFAADLAGRRLLKRGIEIRLQEQPFQVLAVLLEDPGETVSREELRRRLWPTDTFVAFDEGLNAAVNRLRRALGDSADNPRFIETIPRQGYRFIAPITGPELDGEARESADGSRESAPRRARKSWIRNPWVHLTAVALAAVGLTTSVWFLVRRARGGMVNPQAIQECQQGRELWRQRSPESLVKAIEHFKKATVLDPSYAPAYSGLADAYLVLPFLSTVSQDEAYPKAREAAGKAIALNPSLAEAHTSAADVKLYADWDFSGADREFRRALELDPNYATAHQWYAEYLSLIGRHEEAIREIQRAQQLEPLSVIMYHQAGQIFRNARQYDKAIEQYNRALEINGAFDPSAFGLSDALRAKGMYRLAIETDRKYAKTMSFYDPSGAPLLFAEKLAHAYAANGEQGYWRTKLEGNLTESNSHPAGWFYLAIDYAQLAQPDKAMFWLDKAYEKRSPDVLSVKVEPRLDPLRSDARFQDLMKRVGLPQ